jgi:hypothetical protein
LWWNVIVVGLDGGVLVEQLAVIDPDVLAGAADRDDVAAVDLDRRQALVVRRRVDAGRVDARGDAGHRHAQVLDDDVVVAGDLQSDAVQEGGAA